MKILREWKKATEEDLGHIISEMKDLLVQPSCVILTGDLGAGKTTFVKNYLSQENPHSSSAIENEAHSPTYSVVYEEKNMAHADLYRIEEQEDIYHLELPLYLENKDIFFVEWGRKYLPLLEREVPGQYNFFELKIEVMENAHKNDYRHYGLYSLDRNTL